MIRRNARRGFTLTDLLVSIVIAAALGTLLLPALAKKRERAQDQGCTNKLKQLVLAMHNHHDVYKKFPAVSNQGVAGGVASVWWPAPGAASPDGIAPSAGYTTGAGTSSATAGYSWMVRLLPFMDEAPLYNVISQASRKFTADAFTPYNVEGKAKGGGGQTFSVSTTSGGVTTTRHFAVLELDEAICPGYSGDAAVSSSPYQGRPAGDPPTAYGFPTGSNNLGVSEKARISNYVALTATHLTCMRYSPIPKVAATTDIPADAEAPNGTIIPGSGLNLNAVTDGASKTLLLCETIEPAMSSWYDGTTAWTTAINPNSLAAKPPSKADPTPDGGANPLHHWVVPAGGTTALNVGPQPIATTAYCPALEGYAMAPQVVSWGPSSNHAGGVVNHAAVDGSVHGIASDIDPTLYMHLVTRAGGEPDAIPE